MSRPGFSAPALKAQTSIVVKYVDQLCGSDQEERGDWAGNEYNAVVYVDGV